MHKLRRHIHRRYKKIACAIAGAACLSAALIHGVPGIPLPAPAPKPLGQEAPAAAPGVAPPAGDDATPPAPPGPPAPGNVAAPLAREVPLAPAAARSIPTPKKPFDLSQRAGPLSGAAGRESAPPAPAARVAPLPALTPPPAAPAPPPAAKPSPEAGAERVLEMTATAYAPGPQDNDQWGTKTHMGTEVRPGVIAVDPRIIPLGSRVMIKYPDGHREYAVAEDTGGAIKGRRIDVAKWTEAEANRFGIKAVRVYVLQTPAERNQPEV